MTPSRNDVVNDYLAGLDSVIRDLFVDVREQVLSAGVDLDESIKWRDCLVYSTSRNLIQTVLGKGRISLIFFQGAELDDGRGLLEGGGKTARTFRISGDGYDRDALQGYVRAAALAI